ncbi:MAG: hypothetical protein RSD96_03335 [Bacilli bacterium]
MFNRDKNKNEIIIKKINEDNVVEVITKNIKTPNIFYIVLKTILSIVVISCICMCFIDYLITVNNKKPIFCLIEETNNKNDDHMYKCTGFIYKYYIYKNNKDVFKKFGGLWLDDKSIIKEANN